ncbi:hypothetical protein D0T87_04750 [Bacteroides sp. 51]|nr:hypothetical protein [Bacteroides sp. 51]
MELRDIHNTAMYKVDQGDLQKNMGNLEIALNLYKEAYSLEQDAAHLALRNNLPEPTVSILLKSSAALAMRCDYNRDAEKLISLALSRDVPLDIADELRDMLETVHFKRHFELKGEVLGSDEVRLVVAGQGVGYGFAKTNEVFDRVEIYEKLTTRTIERKSGQKYRTSGVVPESMRIQPFISAPHAASMAFIIRFAGLQEQSLPGFSRFEEIIEDINDNIELISAGDYHTLKKNIPDESYFDNFVGSVKKLAPDGKVVKIFGITSMKGGVARNVELTTSKFQISSAIKQIGVEESIDGERKTVDKVDQHSVASGILSMADRAGKVRITTQGGEEINFTVPDGLADIVKTYWEQNVVVDFVKKGRGKVLRDINLFESEYDAD